MSISFVIPKSYSITRLTRWCDNLTGSLRMKMNLMRPYRAEI